MRMAVLQHVPFEGPAAIAEWALSRGVLVAETHLYRGDALPALNAFDMLTAMGGPMSANDEALLDWLTPEIGLVGDAIAAGKTVFGVCLGAQIIAKSLGAKIYAAPAKEIGWLPVQRTEAAHTLFEGLSRDFIAFHWHGETFDLPEGAVRLARTASTENQAFAIGNKVLGLQFHMEATTDSVNALIENASGDIGDGPYEQKPEAILAGGAHFASLRSELDRVLDNLTKTTKS